MIRIAILFFLSLLTGLFTHIVPVEMGTRDNFQNPVVRFGVITDVQYCNCDPDRSRHYARSLAKLKDAVTVFNRQELSFLINLGDLIDHDLNSYDSVIPILSESIAPVYNVLGNHDFSVEKRERGDIFQTLNTGPGYYSFSIEGFRFIVLNSSDVSIYSPVARSRNRASKLLERLTIAGQVNAFDWNGTIGDRQKEWLISQLDEAANQEEKVILFSHHPVWPESQYSMFEFEKIVGITEGYDNIGAWFSGHNHEGGYGNYNHIHFVTFRGMVETEEMNSYAVVELYHNKIWINGYGREKSQILAW